jgi:hypothetical protein
VRTRADAYAACDADSSCWGVGFCSDNGWNSVIKSGGQLFGRTSTCSFNNAWTSDRKLAGTGKRVLLAIVFPSQLATSLSQRRLVCLWLMLGLLRRGNADAVVHQSCTIGWRRSMLGLESANLQHSGLRGMLVCSAKESTCTYTVFWMHNRLLALAIATRGLRRHSRFHTLEPSTRVRVLAAWQVTASRSFPASALHPAALAVAANPRRARPPVRTCVPCVDVCVSVVLI